MWAIAPSYMSHPSTSDQSLAGRGGGGGSKVPSESFYHTRISPNFWAWPIISGQKGCFHPDDGENWVEYRSEETIVGV